MKELLNAIVLAIVLFTCIIVYFVHQDKILKAQKAAMMSQQVEQTMTKQIVLGENFAARSKKTGQWLIGSIGHRWRGEPDTTPELAKASRFADRRQADSMIFECHMKYWPEFEIVDISKER